MPSSLFRPSALEAAVPLGVVGREAFDDEDAVVSGEGEDAVEVAAAGERGVEDDGEAEANLRGGDAPEGVVGEVIEGGGGGGGERKSGVADVVFVEERAAKRGGYGFCYGGFPCAWVPLHRYYHWRESRLVGHGVGSIACALHIQCRECTEQRCL